MSHDAVTGPAFLRRLGDVARRARAAAVRPTRGKLALAALFLLALALRLAWTAYVDPSPRDGRFDDSSWYDGSAQSIADGKGYVFYDGAPTAAWPVGYPAFLAGIYRVTGDSVPAEGCQRFPGGPDGAGGVRPGSAGLWPRAGWAAALVLTFFPNQVFFSTLVMSEILSAFLLLLVLLAVLYLTLDRERAHWWGAAVVGLLIGLAALVRGEFLLFFLVPLLPWRLVLGTWRRALGYAGVALAAVALVLTPWTVRNAVRLGYPVVVSTGAVANLLAGHWAGADGAGTFAAGKLSRRSTKASQTRSARWQCTRLTSARPWLGRCATPGRRSRWSRASSITSTGATRRLCSGIQTRPVMGPEREDWFTTASNGYYYAVAGRVPPQPARLVVPARPQAAPDHADRALLLADLRVCVRRRSPLPLRARARGGRAGLAGFGGRLGARQASGAGARRGGRGSPPGPAAPLARGLP